MEPCGMNDTIARETDRMERELAMTKRQRDNASDAGVALAAVVERYVAAPQEVGRQALRDAYGEFMAAHAGNFSATVVGPTIAVRCPSCGAAPGEPCRWISGDGTPETAPGVDRPDPHFYRTRLQMGSPR
jgi:hypothetical protein